MSHNDYTKYARENRTEAPVVETVVDETPVIEPEVAETPVVEVGETPVVEEEPTVEVPRMMGRVFGCARLNVRKNPKPRAEVICEINADTEVEIDESASTVDFYKVCTASGIEGYCVKTYINVNPKK